MSLRPAVALTSSNPSFFVVCKSLPWQQTRFFVSQPLLPHLQRRSRVSGLSSHLLPLSPYAGPYEPSVRFARSYRGSPKAEKKRDLYEVLGVSKDVSKAELKKAYYMLAKKYHPDTNKGDKDAAAKFTELSNAYEILSDDAKRAQYDKFGHEAAESFGQSGGMPGGMGGFTSEEQAMAFFSHIFGGSPFGGNPFGAAWGESSGEALRPQQGGDLQTSLTIDFIEAVNGCRRDVQIQSQGHCVKCDGTGDQPGTTARTCTKCGGSGVLTASQGFFAVQTTCRSCGGQGQMRTSCSSCRGSGLVPERRTVEVTIPPGVNTNTMLRLVGQGDAGELKGPRGHLWIKLKVRDHPVFKRQSADVHCDISIPLSTALLGGTVQVPTLKGPEELKIDAGTQHSETKTLVGKGIKQLNSSSYGNEIVHILVEIPKSLTPKQRQLIEQFAIERGERPAKKVPKPPTKDSNGTDNDASNPSPSAKTIFTKLKDMVGKGAEEKAKAKD